MRRSLLLLPLVLVLLAGCRAGGAQLPPAGAAAPGAGVLNTAGGSARVGSLVVLRQVVVTADQTVRETRRITATDRLARLWREQAEALKQAGRLGWQLNTQDLGNQFTVTMTRHFKDFDEFNHERAGKLEVVSHPLFQKVKFSHTVLAVDANELAEEFPAPEGTRPEDWTAYLKGVVRLEQSITLPARVSSHNMDNAAGDTAQWGRTAGALSGTVELNAETRVFRRWPMVLAGAAALLLIGGPIAIAATRRWWDREANM